MSDIKSLLSQKMALERMIEQAQVDELERIQRIESERLAVQNDEIANVRKSLRVLMEKYDLTEDQVLREQEEESSIQAPKPTNGKKLLSMEEMRSFYSKYKW